MSTHTREKARKSEMKYSDQAIDYIRVLPDFDLEEFEKWFKDNITIGGGDIMAFLIQKKKNPN